MLLASRLQVHALAGLNASQTACAFRSAIYRIRSTTVKEHVRAAFAPELESRFAGSLYGGAVGDAMGAAFEFVSSASI